MERKKRKRRPARKRASIPGTAPYAEVQGKIVRIREQPVIVDADVAELYGVDTKRVNEAVRNNPDKFPPDYMFELDASESRSLRSKFSSLENPGRGRHSKYNYKAFTEKGLYMLATILKGRRATEATFAIVETFAKVRGLKRELVDARFRRNADGRRHARLGRRRDGILAGAELLHRKTQAHGPAGQKSRRARALRPRT